MHLAHAYECGFPFIVLCYVPVIGLSPACTSPSPCPLPQGPLHPAPFLRVPFTLPPPSTSLSPYTLPQCPLHPAPSTQCPLTLHPPSMSPSPCTLPRCPLHPAPTLYVPFTLPSTSISPSPSNNVPFTLHPPTMSPFTLHSPSMSPSPCRLPQCLFHPASFLVILPPFSTSPFATCLFLDIPFFHITLSWHPLHPPPSSTFLSSYSLPRCPLL